MTRSPSLLWMKKYEDMNVSLSSLAEEILSRISILAPWVTKTTHPNPLPLLIFLKPEFPFKLPTAPHYIPVEGFQRTLFSLAGRRAWDRGPRHAMQSAAFLGGASCIKDSAAFSFDEPQGEIAGDARD